MTDIILVVIAVFLCCIQSHLGQIARSIKAKEQETVVECERCRGTGYKFGMRCPICNGGE